MSVTDIPFNQRFGIESAKPIDNDFPASARIALAHLMDDLNNKSALREQSVVLNELLRAGRFTGQEFETENYTPFFRRIILPLQKMDWWRVYTFCERVYSHLLSTAGYHENEYTWIETMTIPQVQEYFATELNIILAEENLAYSFVNGQFQRRGRVQTQKSIQRMGAILATPSLLSVRTHYNKARKFFDERPEPDVENCVKEAVCALEACLEILTEESISGNFVKAVKQIKEIPPTIADGMIKLYAYRGDGKGVTHAASEGSKVSEIEAELVLNLVASYITYLVDLLSEPEEIPF